jgi:hypothetical protein
MFRFELVFKAGRILLWAGIHGVYYKLSEYLIVHIKHARGCRIRLFLICVYFLIKVFSMPLVVYVCLSSYSVQTNLNADVVVQLAIFLVMSVISLILTIGCIMSTVSSTPRPISCYVWLCLLKLIFIIGLTISGAMETIYILHWIESKNVVRYTPVVIASVVRTFSFIMVLVVENLTSVYMVLLFYSSVFHTTARARTYKIWFILSGLCAMMVTVYSGITHSNTGSVVSDDLLLSYSVPFMCTIGPVASGAVVKVIYSLIVWTTISSITTALLIMAHCAYTTTIIRIITVLMSFGPSWLLVWFPSTKHDATTFYLSVLSVIDIYEYQVLSTNNGNISMLEWGVSVQHQGERFWSSLPRSPFATSPLAPVCVIFL